MCIPRNTCFIEPIPVHNTNDISIGSAIFAQFTAQCRRACTAMSFPLKVAHSHGAIWAPSNTWLLDNTRTHNPNGISIGSAAFAQFTEQCHMLYNQPPLTPSKLPISMEIWILDPPSSTWFLGSIRANNPKKNPYGISIGPAVFAGGHYCDGPRDRPSDRPTDQATRSVTKKPHLYVRIVLQCGLIK